MQGPYRQRAAMNMTVPAPKAARWDQQEIPYQPDAHAAYSYALADASAKDQNTDFVPQVPYLLLRFCPIAFDVQSRDGGPCASCKDANDDTFSQGSLCP